MHQTHPRYSSPLTNLALIAAVLFTIIAGAFVGPSQRTNAAAPFTSGNLSLLVAAASASNTTGSIVEINTTTAGQSAIQAIALPDTASPDSYRISGSATSTGYVSLSNDRSLLTFTGANSTTTGATNVNTLNPRGVYTVDAAGTVVKQTTYTGASGSQTRSATSIDNTTWYIGDQGGFYSNGSTSASPSGNIRSVKSFGGTVYAFTASATLAPVGIISAATGGTYTALAGLGAGATTNQDFYLIQSGDNGSTYDILYVLNATSATVGTISKYSLVAGSWVPNGTYTTTFGGFGLAAADADSGAVLYISTGTGATVANSVVKVADAAGYNATMNVTTANVTLYTTAAGTIIKGLDFAPVATNTPTNTPTNTSTHTPTSTSTTTPTSTATTIPTSSSVVDLSTYVRVGRFGLPEPTRTTPPSGNLLAQEASGVAYNWDTDTLFVVGDGGKAVTQVSKTGALIDTMTLASGASPQGTDFYDTEGITYIGGGQFVMTEERDRQIVKFTYAAGTTLNRSGAQTVKLGTFVDNIGLEGVSYDPQTGGFILAKEITPEGIFQTNVDWALGTATNGSPTTVDSINLFDPALANLLDFADVFALSNLPSQNGQPDSGNLLVLSQASGKIVSIDRAGNIASSLQITADLGSTLSVPDQQHEGLTMDRNGNLYVVSENGGGDINHPQLWVYAPSLVPNQAPTAVAFNNAITSIQENTSTVAPIKVADIVVIDDGLGTNNLTLTGSDASFFEITNSGLYIKAGTVLDYETKTSYSVTINVDDPTLGSTPDATTNYTLLVTNVANETPATPSVFISEVHPSGSGNLVYSADWFEITNAGTSAVDITGWQMDDNSNGTGNVALRGITSIPAGKSAVFFEGAADGSTDATIIANFSTAWFGSATPPAGFLIGSYGGAGVGLSTSGDSVNLFDATGNRITGVSFGVATTGVTFDNHAGLGSAALPLPAISTLSVAGTNAAFLSANGTETGSPGTTGKLLITEVAPWSSGNSPVAADWFEVTNTSATVVDLTGWKMDDSSQSFVGAVALNGITSIAPGESVIFLESATPITTIPIFLNTWFGANAPTSLQVGSYTGSGVGLSTAGDAVNLYNSIGELQASVSFGTAPLVAPFATFDNAVGLNNVPISQLSAVGTNGAFVAANDANEIGSPGTAVLAVSIPTPTPTNTPTATAAETSTPTATATATNTPVAVACSTSDTLIGQVQGSTDISPLSGQNVTVQGVVVGDYEGAQPALRGFYLQDSGDGNSTTSDGIFVFDNGADNVSLGQVVQVTGVVSEIQNQTQITLASFENCGSTANVTPVDVSLPFADATFAERYEGMLVRFPQTLYVTEHFQLGRFGQVLLSSSGKLRQPTNIVAPGASALAQQIANDLNQIILDDETQAQNPDPIRFGRGGLPLSASNTLRGGDTAAGIVGVMTYTWAGNAASGNAYRLRPINALGGGVPNFQPSNPRPTAPGVTGGSLKATAANLLNYFNTFGLGACTGGSIGAATDCRGADTQAEFDRQWPKTVEELIGTGADVIGVMELENDGYGPNSAIVDLVTKLNNATAPGTYAFINPDVATGQTDSMGTDAIRVAIIYKPANVTPVGNTTVLNSVAFVNGGDGAPRGRPALAQAFEENATGGRFIIVPNHFKSKGSACDVADANDGQGNCNIVRKNEATELTNWLANDPTGTGDPDILIVGDLNSYAQEDPITIIKGAGYVNLIENRVGIDGYSYVFDGQWGYLDHALASVSLNSQITGISEWHINSDEPSVLDYNTDFKSAGQISSLYNADFYRTSDHDPVIIGMNLVASVPTATPTATQIGAPTATPTNTPTSTSTATNTPTPTNTPIATVSDVVISQVYGGGGNAGATLTNDFIELFNRGTTTVNLNGWSVQYTSAAGTSWQVTNLTGSIAPGGYYLVQEAVGAGGTVPLPTPDAIGTIAMSGTSGKVALSNGTTALSCGISCIGNAAVVDVVGYGTANNFEGAGAAPVLTNTTAALRAGNGCVDTNNNNLDFSAVTPNPRNSASPLNVCGTPATNTPTVTNTATATHTATATATDTAVPPTATHTPTATNTAVPPTATDTATATNTPVPPTATNTPTPTNTAVPPTATDTATPTNTAVPPTATDTATPTNTPTASLVKILGAPNSSPEGKLISLSNNAVARGRTYAWVVTKSGVLYASGSAATFSFIPNDNASYIVTLTVRNGAAIIGSDSKTITVTNVAPRAIFGGSASVRTNTSFVLALLLPSDPSSVDRSAGFSYAFDCGDGQGWRIQLSSSIRCQAPATPSTITVQGRITDKDGGVSIYRGTITVRR